MMNLLTQNLEARSKGEQVIDFAVEQGLTFFVSRLFKWGSRNLASRKLFNDKGGANSSDKEVNLLVEALNKVGGSNAVSKFLGWKNKETILKSAPDFTKDQLINAGYTKEVLTEIHSGLLEAAKKTIPSTGKLNPASILRANQIEEILKMHF